MWRISLALTFFDYCVEFTAGVVEFYQRGGFRDSEWGFAWSGVGIAALLCFLCRETEVQG